MPLAEITVPNLLPSIARLPAYGFARGPPGSRPAAHSRGDGDRIHI
jgi:hypothetical protein